MIDKSHWYICKLCNKKIQDLARIYGGNGIYYTQVFKKHLELDHQLTINKYFDLYLKRPICACNICKQQVDIVIKSANFIFRKYKCGRNDGVLKWGKDAKKHRRGKGNPMYGKKPWNKGVTKYDHPSMMQAALANTGRITSKETRIKQSKAAKLRIIHGHTGHKHSKDNRKKFRQNTLKMIRDGKFKHTKTKPHLIMSEILKKLKLKFVEESIKDYWSFDFYISIYNVYIEVDGDYFHSNPKFYPDGPKTKTQKINWYRDIKKNQYCQQNDIKLLRFWECDILNNREEIICTLKKLLN